MPAGRRVPAGDVEGLVIDRLIGFLAHRTAAFAALQAAGISDAAQQQHLLRRADDLQQRFAKLTSAEQRLILAQLLRHIELSSDAVALHLLPAGLVRRLAGNPMQPVPEGVKTLMLAMPAQLRRVGLEMKLLVEGQAPKSAPDTCLQQLIAKAHALRERMLAEQLGVGELAELEGLTGSYVTRLLRLTFLTPDIVKAIIAGDRPPTLTAARLLGDSRLPCSGQNSARCSALADRRNTPKRRTASPVRRCSFPCHTKL